MTDIFIILLILLSVYVGLYTLYYVLCVYLSTKERRLYTKNKFFNPPYENNIVMVLYCKNDEGNVASLLEAMNKQDYPKSNYQTHIILDNCSDETSNKLEFIGGAKIWRLGDGEAIGKDEAVSWLLERLVSLQNVNAFAFLEAKRMIAYDYLSSLNKALFSQDVIVAETEIVDSKNTLTSNIKCVYNKYSNKISLLPRTLMGLSTVINSDACAMKQEVIEKIRCVDFKDLESELKYTTLLLKSGFNCFYNPNVKTQLDIEYVTSRKTNSIFRFDILRHCFGLFFKSRPQFSEFVINNVKPNIWFLMFTYVGLLVFSYNYYFFFDFSVILIFACMLFIAFIASIFTSGIGGAGIKYLLLYPFYRSCKNLEKSRFYSYIGKFFIPKTTFVDREVLTVDAIATDGKNNLHCYLDLISEDGLAKAVFRYKKKKYASNNQIRMYDAVSEIVEKLDSHGFRIKICHSCGCFNSKSDGSINMVKGECLKCKVNESVINPVDTLIYSSCEDYIPREIGKVIDINNYRQ